MGVITNKPHYEHLREKWTGRHKSLQEKLWAKHKDSFDWISRNLAPKQLAMGSLGGLFLLTAPASVPLPPPHIAMVNQQTVTPIPKNAFIVSNLSHILPNEVRILTVEEEKKITEILSRDFGITVTAELSGKRLNRSYGFIGQEQHLARFPGDNMSTHFDPPAGGEEERIKFGREGMAPGLGAWGYIGDTTAEKYYIAVQTFLAPGFLDHVKEYVDFFKYRKMLVVNPNNGNAVVAVIGDAGPAQWTGKSLGGSPEVMRHLERVDGTLKGPVLYFFIDDPSGTIPLGPISPV